ncbi:MAG TPA: DNRLRE domain-containing protein [Allosphingosinicella sp.]|jgi:hypothetical protein
MRLSPFLVLVACLWALLVAAQPAVAQTSSTLSPTQDTDIRANATGSNCGSCTTVNVRAHSTGEYRALYQFDLSGIPSGQRLTSATLRIWVTTASSTAVSVHRVTQSWGESTLTWANSSGLTHDSLASASFTPSATSRYYDIDVTSLVTQWRSGTANYGLMLRIGGSNSSAAFTSREWSTTTQRPQLVVVTQPAPSFSTAATTAVSWDTYNLSVNPKLIPGAIALRSLKITSSSAGYADSNSFVVVQAVPTQTSLYVKDLGSTGSGPLTFAQGTPTSGLTYTYTSLSSTTDDVSFSNDNGATYNYTPVPDASGYDGAVTHIKVSPKGTFAAAGSSGSPNFTISYRFKVD